MEQVAARIGIGVYAGWRNHDHKEALALGLRPLKS